MTEFPRVDLGAALSRLLTVVVEREAPVLEAHGLTMWEYVILDQLAEQAGMTQKELALRSRRDPTRLIANLDALHAKGLIDREVDAADRRRRLIRLTEQGTAVMAATKNEIRAMEDDLLGPLGVDGQNMLHRSLTTVLQHTEPRP